MNSTSPPTPCATVIVCKTSNCDATMSIISTLWELNASLIQLQRATSACASPRPTSIPCKISMTMFASAFLASPARQLLQPGHPRRRRHAGAHHRPMQSRHGYRLQRHLGLPSFGHLLGQHPLGVRASSIAAAIGHRTKANWPRCSTKPSPPVCGAASTRSCCAATPISRRPSISIAGMPTAASPSFSATPAARYNLKALAEQLPAKAWKKLTRPARYQAVTGLRHRPVNVKDKICARTWFRNLAPPQRRSG